MPVGAQSGQQSPDFFKSATKRRQIGNLTANVNINTDRFNPVQSACMGETGFGLFPGNAEFGFRRAGGNFFMRARFNIGIDAQRNLRGFAQSAGGFGQ